MNKIDVQITKNEKGIPDEVFHIMQPDINGNIWFIGNEWLENAHAYKFDGKTATKYSFDKEYEITQKCVFAAGPKGEIYFTPTVYLNLKHPTIVCINTQDEAYEIECTNYDDNFVIEKMLPSTDALVCALASEFSKTSEIHRVENNVATPLGLDHVFKIQDMLFTTSGELLVITGMQEAHVIDLDSAKRIRTIDINKDNFSSYNLRALPMPMGIVLMDFEKNWIQVRDQQGKLLHDISIRGKTDHPVSKALAQISEESLELANMTKMDDETLLLILRDWAFDLEESYDGTEKNLLRTLHLPTMELRTNPFEDNVRGTIHSSIFDKNGTLWLSHLDHEEDTTKIYKITPDNKRVDSEKKLFVG